MTAEAIYAIGTLATWIGLAFVLRSVSAFARLLGRSPSEDVQALRKSLFIALALAGLGLVVGGSMKIDPGRAVESGWNLPLVWFTMSGWGWIGILMTYLAVSNLIQEFMAISAADKRASLIKFGIYLLIAGACIAKFVTDKSEVTVLRGVVALTPGVAFSILLFLCAAVFVMSFVSRAAVGRGRSKMVATHLALLAGSFVFALPFAWLVITSFKEDRDMASPNGIVWVPRVQVTVPYMDPKQPLYKTTYEGQTIEGNVISEGPGGSVTVDILRPPSVRGRTVATTRDQLVEIPKQIPIVTTKLDGVTVQGAVIEELEDGRRRIRIDEPVAMKGQDITAFPSDVEPVRVIGLRGQNYSDALDFLPPETNRGLVYVKNTLILVVLSVLGTLLSSSLVAYAFSRMKFPGSRPLFLLLLSTMMLPAAVTLLPTFLIFRSLGWIDTLYPLWVPAFLGSAFNIFMLRQFFMTIPMELEDAAKIDGCSYLKTFWSVMLPQIQPALAVIAIWTFMGAWNNFMGPLIYINSPENMPIAYAVQLFQSERGGEPGLLMAFATMAMIPVLLVFFFAQKYFIEGVTLSGIGGR